MFEHFWKWTSEMWNAHDPFYISKYTTDCLFCTVFIVYRVSGE